MSMPNKLKPSDLRCWCDAAQFDFDSTLEIEPLDEVIGQERAVRAIEFGLNMKSFGYNIFITGYEGTGKNTISRDLVGKHAAKMSVPTDWCIVNNFKDEYRPKAIAVPAGTANVFAKSMNRFIQDLKVRLPKEFESESFREKISEINGRYQQQIRLLFQGLDESAAQKRLQIKKTPTGYQTIPLKDDAPYTQEDFAQLPAEIQADIGKNIQSMQAEIEEVLREASKINFTQQENLQQVTEQVALFVVKNRLDILREAYRESEDIIDYLNKVQEDIVENVDLFGIPKNTGEEEKEDVRRLKQFAYQRYIVNAIVDRTGAKGAPSVFEPNPTFQNIFGRIDKKSFMGAVVTDFSMIKAGSLLLANGGFLILEIESVLANPNVWEGLKRALQNKQVFIEDFSDGKRPGSAPLRPEPIPLDVKVILLGSYETFRFLQNKDPRFNKIFKVRADFDHEVTRSDHSVALYANFVARVCKAENLLPFRPDGIAAIVEYGQKAIADKNKLSLRFGPVVDIIKEADFWAREEAAERVSGRHVFKAFTEHRFRSNMHEEKIHENYVKNLIMIDTDGEVAGQVNALSVYQMGDIAFGRPSRITAETFMGKQGVINIEREAQLSGNTHDKGVLILSGYLGRTFAQKYPLNLSISITFEQNYGGIDGDSASSTELYAILSSLSEIPIIQGIAVTGSVNQKGRIQAIGGVNYKIEGFFDVCKAKGLTGKQGVLIPQANVNNLMLKKEVIDAVKHARFHIYQVASVEEGIEILTGVPAGVMDANGDYQENTVYGKVQKKLETYVMQAQKYQKMLHSENDNEL
jgi:predicted ATP-dependent protease